MLKLKDVIEQIVEEFQVVVVKDYLEEKNINRVDVLSPYTILDKDTLYLCADTALLSDESYLQSLPKDVKKYYLLTSYKGDCPFTTIRLGHKLNVRQLFLKINAYLKFEDLIEHQISELYKDLYNGMGLAGIIKTAESFLNAPISVCDASYNMIETSPLMKKIPYGMVQTEEHTFLKNEEIESLKKYRVVDQIYNTDGAFCIITPDHPDNHWIFCSIRIQKVMTGFVAVCIDKRDGGDYELRLTEALATICSIEMQKHDFFLTRTGMKYENFLIDLLEGKFNDVNMVSSRIELLDRKFHSNFCILVFTCTEPHDSRVFNDRQLSTLRTAFMDSLSVVYHDMTVFFLNQPEPVVFSDETIEKLSDFASLNHMKIGISQPFNDILKTKDFYEQALTAATLGEEYQPENMLYFSSDFIPLFLLQHTANTELPQLIHYMIYRLQEYDQEYHTEFILTLRTYLHYDRNATKASDALHIHRSTFFYRIKKIEELLDISISDSHLLFLFELSFKIWDYLS